MHKGPGIDDRESHIYREFDSKGRCNQTFYQRAALQGIKNLDSNAYQRDSSVSKMKGRFPEKYVKAASPLTRGGKGAPSYSSRHGSAQKDLNSSTVKQNIMERLVGAQSKTESSPKHHDKQEAAMSKDEEQLILEAAFSAVSDNILASQMHGNT